MGHNNEFGGETLDNDFSKNILEESDVEYKIRDNKVVDETWDFRKANTKEYTHCFHPYPAMMIPQIARRLIENFGKKSKLLFDPYCGTGTSLVEANIKGINAIGTDINPLARLIATTKTTKLDIQVLDLFLQDFINFFFSINFQIAKTKSIVIPNITNIDFWFSKKTQQQLLALKGYIDRINDHGVRNFFNVAFSETIREVSNIKRGEFKLVRSKNYEVKQESDTFAIMVSKLSRNKIGLIDFNNVALNQSTSTVASFNTINEIPKSIIKPCQVDIVITSPPYGDSKTTVAYGQYSRLSNEWLGYKAANKVDGMLMGGERKKEKHFFTSKILNDVVEIIEKEDALRAKDVIAFYDDYEKSINNVSVTLKKGGFACYVVGNRTVKGLSIPTDEITAQLFEANNFTHIETIVRNIPSKRMPLKNSPSNIVGKTASTMKNEYIVICQKN